MNSAILTFSTLSTGYRHGRKDTVVSRGLSGMLPEGKVTAFIGINGAGKSTLLRTLSGLLPPLSGHIVWHGREIKDIPLRQLAQTVAVVLTTRPSTGRLTAREIVELGRTPHTGFSGILSRKDHDKVDHAMQRTDTEGFAHRPFSSLSDGERQRVLVAKALAQDTPAIFLDEPCAFLDFTNRIEILRLFRTLAHEEGKTVLFSTHDLETSFLFAENLWTLSPDGLHTGTPQEQAGNGVLDRMFHVPGIMFDKETLRFSLQEKA